MYASEAICNQITSQSVKRLQRYGDLTFFQHGGRSPSWISWAPIGTTHDDHLRVSIVVQNLVEIDAVVSISWNFQFFARLAWKRLFTPQKLGFSGDFTPKMGSNVNETPKRHILARVHVVWAINRENPSSRLTCRWVHEKKGINKKISLYFAHLPRSPPSTDLHQIWHSRRGRRRNHLYQFFWWSVKGCLFCGGSKIAITHWQSQSPLTQGWRYRAARDIRPPVRPMAMLTLALSVGRMEGMPGLARLL